jgi:hypothetical protein
MASSSSAPDHMVPLKNAHESGGWAYSAERSTTPYPNRLADSLFESW